ncbi:MAG: PilZ domain-containing protein [Magnetococcales bacterium]|nr:PilZ domain-containing protein [Magnetococcales bacterium]
MNKGVKQLFQNLLGLKGSSSTPSGMVRERGPDVIRDPARITDIMTQAMTQELPLQLHLDKLPLTYYSGFQSPEEDDPKALWISPLDPQEGNAQLAVVSQVEISFFAEKGTMRALLRVEEQAADGSIRLNWPEKLLHDTQKRSLYRVDVDSSCGIKIQLWDSQGKRLPINPLDISTGGISFSSQTVHETLAKGNRVRVQFLLPEGEESFGIDGVMLGSVAKDRIHHIYRLRFLIASYEVARRVEELVAMLQRRILQKRSRISQSRA